MYILDDYDSALQQILKTGSWKWNRTGIKSLSLCGISCRYRIDERFPILTRRKVWPKAIWAELLWILSGSTNNKDLQALGSNIWTPWVDQQFEARNGYAAGSLGPVYGFQLRHFGGCYGNGIGGDSFSDLPYSELSESERENVYGKGGFDQLAYIVDKLRNDPMDRRILFSLWNPQDLSKMRLPPCHYTFQLFVDGDNRLSGTLTQRSCDFPVGVCANIQFYSTLIHMLAQQCGLTPNEFVHFTVDSHIYEDQIPAVEEYLSRPTPDSPRFQLKEAQDIGSYTLDHFVLSDYNPEPAIKIPVAV